MILCISPNSDSFSKACAQFLVYGVCLSPIAAAIKNGLGC